MISKKNNIILLMIIILMLMFIVVQSVPVITRLSNPQVVGSLFGKDDKFCGERAWGVTGTADTLVVTGVDTNCAVFLQPKTTQIENLIYDIKSAGDTIFVTSDSAGTASTDKYSYMIIQDAYGATD